MINWENNHGTLIGTGMELRSDVPPKAKEFMSWIQDKLTQLKTSRHIKAAKDKR